MFFLLLCLSHPACLTSNPSGCISLERVHIKPMGCLLCRGVKQILVLTEWLISLLIILFPQTQLESQHLTANVLEVKASQTQRHSTPDASSSCPSVVAFHQPTLSPGSGSSPPPPPDDLGPSCLTSVQDLSACLYKPPSPAPNSFIHSHATGSSPSEHSSQCESESSTAILVELQLRNSDTTDCSETPSPTWGQRSAVTDGITLATPAATHVIMLPSFDSAILLRTALVRSLVW